MFNTFYAVHDHVTYHNTNYCVSFLIQLNFNCLHPSEHLWDDSKVQCANLQITKQLIGDSQRWSEVLRRSLLGYASVVISWFFGISGFDWIDIIENIVMVMVQFATLKVFKWNPSIKMLVCNSNEIQCEGSFASIWATSEVYQRNRLGFICWTTS